MFKYLSLSIPPSFNRVIRENNNMRSVSYFFNMVNDVTKSVGLLSSIQQHICVTGLGLHSSNEPIKTVEETMDSFCLTLPIQRSGAMELNKFHRSGL